MQPTLTQPSNNGTEYATLTAQPIVNRSDTLIDIHDLHVKFRTNEGIVHALRGVNLQIRRGETFGLVGESGSGKSVTAQAILRIIPTSGHISGGNILFTPRGAEQSLDLAQINPHSCAMRKVRGRDIAMIFQEPMTSLSPVHTIGAQIIEAVRLHEKVSKKTARDRAIDLLRLVGIPRPELRVDSYSFELSGGMRQRAMIAIALSCDPSLLIADEPTTALDVTIQAQILELLQRLQEELKMSILMITHNLGVIAALAHRVAVMYLGQVVEEGSKEQLFANPRHPYTQGLLHSVPRIGAPKGERLWAISGTVPSPYAQVIGCAFHPRCDQRIAGTCDLHYPATRTVDQGHFTACHLYETDTPNAVESADHG
jgi:oligopeptide/dipeptide ABC transporter ATP-binding protein